jgi:precorrin-2/cobalt-factor-2 C20-methyltransferase
MKGTLHVIGVGPGDPELMTLKALKALETIKIICVPKGREEGSSLALSIVKKAVSLDDKEIIETHFPMKKTKTGEDILDSYKELDKKWDEAVSIILDKLDEGMDVAFLTLGDPMFYSTFFYLYERILKLSPGMKIIFIPGVSSINASAAAAGISLGLADEKIAILPATYVEDIKTALQGFDTVVLMKVHRVFDKVFSTLKEMDLLDKAICITRIGMGDEKIFTDLKTLKAEDIDYFSTIIVKK